MSGQFLTPLEGTKVEAWDISNTTGRKPILYYKDTVQSIKHSTEYFIETPESLLVEMSLSEPNYINDQKEEPVLKILDKRQEGYSLTFQKWRGVVKEVSGETFIGHLTDLLRNVPEEEAEFYQIDVSDDDKELLCVGAVFYWCIGYTISASNQQRRTSFLRFQRLPIYTVDSVNKITQKVNNIKKILH
jgi:hypothetical protein